MRRLTNKEEFSLNTFFIMKYDALIIETIEYDYLKQTMGMATNRKDMTYHASTEKLVTELKSAKIKDLADMPDDVVRLNSIVTIEMPNGITKTIQVVKPEKSDVATSKISILAPMGLALFGYAQDDEVLWQFPSGIQAVKLLKVEQSTEVSNTAS